MFHLDSLSFCCKAYAHTGLLDSNLRHSLEEDHRRPFLWPSLPHTLHHMKTRAATLPILQQLEHFIVSWQAFIAKVDIQFYLQGSVSVTMMLWIHFSKDPTLIHLPVSFRQS